MNGRKADVVIDARMLAYRRGGIARYAAELARWIPQVAPDLRVVPFVNRRIARLSGSALRVFTPPHHRIERLSLGLELSLRRPRLVHSVDFITPFTAGARSVITVHDLAFLDHPEYLTTESLRYYRQVGDSIARADRIISVSAYTSELLERRFPRHGNKIVTIWNGVANDRLIPNLDRAQDILRAKLEPDTGALLDSGRPVVLTVGTVEPRKRHSLLLRAIEQDVIAQRPVRPVLVIVGQRGWNCEEIVEQIAAARERGDVIWIESAADELLAALYRTATINVVASQDEGFGLPVLEAMQSGLPVIAADRGALPEIAGDAALMVTGDASSEWAIAIARLLDNADEREALIQRGVRRAKVFSWEETTRRTADVYREVLGR